VPPKKKKSPPPPDQVIRVVGARQNNLQNISLDLPLGKLTVITGPSGSGKSSLAFQTLYAEGQRRYVETFSPYVRQFFDRMDKPAVDRIDGIPPAIAIEQKNNVRTTRSTVGTITEINDYLKLLYARHAHAIDPHSGERIRPDTTDSIAGWCFANHPDEQILVLFPVPVPDQVNLSDFFAFLQQQGYLRLHLNGDIIRTDDPEAAANVLLLPSQVHVVQDRVRLTPDSRPRLLESLERALELGKGNLTIGAKTLRPFTTTWCNPKTGFTCRPPTPSLFTFNNPLGACPECRGFGRVIGIDLTKAIPDTSLSLAGHCVKPFQGERGDECQRDLLRHAHQRGLDVEVPYHELTDHEQEWVLYGERDDPEDAWRNDEWYGVKGFFDWMEGKAYKMHVRVFLSRYRSYTKCAKCRGSRLQPAALVFQINGHTLPALWQLPISDLAKWFDEFEAAHSAFDKTSRLILSEITSRLHYLQQVGLGYLTLDRPTRTLSGGEIERVNLTTCLGAALTNTLFVLDEPTVGLHPRDIDALVGIMHGLRDRGNTLLVVEHEETVMRAADHLLDIGPGSGELGGTITYQGPPPTSPSGVTSLPSEALREGRVSVAGQKRDRAKGSGTSSPNDPITNNSITTAFLTGQRSIAVPKSRRTPTAFLEIRGATRHNLRRLDADVPLGVFCCVTGVSGSGKSTFVHDVLYQNLAARFGFESEDDPAPLKSLKIPASHPLDSVRIVDQSPLSRTPRSTPVVYLGAFELIRKLFATSPDGALAGLTPGYFSFNSGAGRCERCWGNGFEKVEMQFLSDLYLTCPECNGSRYTNAALEFRFEDKTIADILNLTVSEAITFFKPAPGTAGLQAGPTTTASSIKSASEKSLPPKLNAKVRTQKNKILNILTPLSNLGLGYLRLGQPLNTLSGGEAQRLKLCTILLESTSKTSAPQRGKPPITNNPTSNNQSTLLILDEPTTGLHFGDIEKLLAVFQRLVDSGHSLLVIEHNLDVIKSADHILDIGPGPGSEGGQIVATGTPEQVAATNTETARFLAPLLNKKYNPKNIAAPKAAEAPPNNPITNNSITISGAREHNLKNIDLVIPRDTFVVVTGLSGSGKSTLAFDIIFAEGQRRFLDSMSPYARQFAEQMEKPDIDRISGLPPTVAIEQRISRGGGKSTVATVTEIYHFLRLLFAKLGIQHCPESGVPVVPQTEEAITQTIRDHLKKGPLSILAPMIRGRKGFHSEIADWAGRHGYSRLFVDGAWKEVEGFQRLERFKEHDLDIEIARFDKAPRSLQPLRDAIHTALKIGKGTLRILTSPISPNSPNSRITNNSITNNLHVFSTARVSPVTGRSFEPLDPSHFSFNSPRGWCKICRGYGHVAAVANRQAKTKSDGYNSEAEAELDHVRKLDKADDAELTTCPDCLGARLNEVARAVHLPTNSGVTSLPSLALREGRVPVASTSKSPRGKAAKSRQITNNPITIQQISQLPVTEAAALIDAIKFTGRDAAIARDILPEISQRLRFLHEVGLSYLQLDRSAKTLSGGEAQRIRLAAQLGSNLRGVLYVLDEPTIGLHPRDNAKLLDTLEALRLKGNSLLVVEHDDDTMSRAGHIIDLGPAAGRFGGEVIASGTLAQIKKNKASVTGHALKHPLVHPLRGERRPLPKASAPTGWLKLKGCHANNLKNINAAFPLGRLTVLTGISGCGKSSLMRGCLAVAAVSNRQAGSRSKKVLTTKPYKSASGFKQLKSIYEVDQSPIGKTSRSCPATYVKLFDEIRKLFAQLPEARLRGFDASRFSFNNEPGRCPECRGNGRIKLEMDFLPSTWTHCEACNGKRYNPATLEVRYNHKSIGDILEMSIDEAATFFEAHPRLQRPLQLLADTGLGYLQLGQASPTLSGGEAQRLKLVTELTKGRSLKSALRTPHSAFRNLYLIEEPSIGLHLEDVKKLIDVLHRLVDEGHTVVVIEHHTGLMAEADYLLDLGPEAGADGGTIVAHGTPEQVAKCRFSRTAPFLRKVLP